MRIRQIFLNISDNTQLIFQTESLLLITTRIGKIHTRLGSNVSQLILALKIFNISIHTTQFTFNNNQTFIDKLRSIHGYLVLVINNVFIINSNKHIENIFCTGNRHVIQNQINNSGRFTGKGDFQLITVTFDNALHVEFDHIYRPTIKYICIIQCGCNHHRTNRCRNRIIQTYIQNLFRMNFSTAYS
ncbi:Uncharacterised protein [Bacteroides salyersiae]|nr:Uncharacterised protein [Bacteroides salyersiae]